MYTDSQCSQGGIGNIFQQNAASPIPVIEFTAFQKLPRLSREVVITEKIDGTNASVCITEDGQFLVGSRTRWITPENDNHGFAAWAFSKKEELMKLGVGHHFGEWWGAGIQRRYGIAEKRFSLFNTARWSDPETRPACCDVVPVLASGIFSSPMIEAQILRLKDNGSIAAPGFMNPEGIVIYHTAAGISFKKTIDKDEIPKSLAIVGK